MQDSRHKINPTQAAFTKTTVTNGAFHVPVQTRGEVGFASQVKSKTGDSGTPKIGAVAFCCQHNIEGVITTNVYF